SRGVRGCPRGHDETACGGAHRGGLYRRETVEAGGLRAYGTNFRDRYRRATLYVDKILKGATPADPPGEQPMKLELVINLKTARTLGLTLPPHLLYFADEVVQ